MLTNGESTVRLDAHTGFRGDAARCLQEAASQLRADPGVAGVALVVGPDGQPLRGGDRSRAFAVFGFMHTSETGEVEERVRRLECRTLVAGEAVLLIHQEGARSSYEGQLLALEELLTRLVLPVASASPVAIPTLRDAVTTPAVAAAIPSPSGRRPVPA